MKKPIKLMLLITISAVFAGAVQAQFGRSEDAIRYRQAVMVLLGQHFGRISEMLKEQQQFNQAGFSEEASVFAMLSKLPWEAFLYPDSDRGNTQLKSGALKSRDAFMQAAQTFETETAGLLAASANADAESLRVQFGNVAKSCKNCHSQFRSR